MDVNYDISLDYVQRQTNHGIVVLSIIRVFRTASPGSPQCGGTLEESASNSYDLLYKQQLSYT